jgi:hypothetical protein
MQDDDVDIRKCANVCVHEAITLLHQVIISYSIKSTTEQIFTVFNGDKYYDFLFHPLNTKIFSLSFPHGNSTGSSSNNNLTAKLSLSNNYKNVSYVGSTSVVQVYM